MKRNAPIRDGLSFDDIVILPSETAVKPSEVVTKARLTKNITLEVPFISAGKDNVTESFLAMTLARLGGIGIIHANMPIGKQVEEVRKVKRAEGRLVLNPITISVDASIAEALDLMTTYKISGLPVVETSQKVVGIITNRDIRFFEDYAKPVSSLMTKEVVTVKNSIEPETAKRMMHQHRIEKLIIVDDQGKCTGLMTVKDIERLGKYQGAARDTDGCLRVGASVWLGKDCFERASALADAGVDALFVESAHGHQRELMNVVSRIRQQRSTNVQIIAGNAATVDAARSMIDAGADAIKVGIGGSPSSASRRLSGIGVPPVNAILAVAEQCSMSDTPFMIEGGLNSSADIAKALAAGADCVVLDHLLAGTDEAPGEIFYHKSTAYKVVNPDAKAQHRPQASILADAYYLDEDGVDTSNPYRGPMTHMINHLATGLRTAMAYAGARDIKSLRETSEFIRAKTAW